MSSEAIQVKEPSAKYLIKAEAQDVPPGYKRTEVGVMPEDWRVRFIGDEIDRLEAGVSVNSVDEEFQMYAHEQAILKTSAVSGGCFIPHESKRIAPKDIKRAKLNPRRDSIIVSRMNTPQLVGECGYVDRDYPDLYLPDRLWMTHLRTGSETSVKWLSYLLSHRPYKTKLRSAATGTSGSMKNISKDSFFSIPIPFPRPAEQRAIAEALSDVDGLLGALEALIAKKRAIKQAAMQQLLTGKTRLPGFSGEWETKQLGEFASIRNTKVPPSSVAPEIPCVELEHIGQGDGRLIEYSESRNSTSTKYRFFEGDVLFGRLRSYLRKYWFADRDGICTTEIWPLVVDEKQALNGFLHAIVQTERFIAAASISYGTHMPRADWTVMKNFEVDLPSVEEQISIATVLSDMDAEIAALEARRDKTRAIKQGMMQQLLTGRVRLVRPQAGVTQADSGLKENNRSNRVFKEAVVIAALAKQFGSEAYPLGRKRYTKLSYLLHRYTDKQVDGYLKKAAGPYNPKTKYGGPEKIAIESGYIREHKSGKFSGFIASDNIHRAEGYFEKWFGADTGKWLEQFRLKKNDDLEVLATVDMAAEELRQAGNRVDVETIKNVLHSHPDWRAKLDRSVFSDARIAEAIEVSRRLFGGAEG